MSMQLIGLAAVTIALQSGAAPESMLPNGNFERVRGGKPVYWSVAGTWPGRATLAKGQQSVHGGRYGIAVTDTQRGTEWFGRVYNAKGLSVVLGAKYRASIWAKGKGELVVGAIEYRVDAQGKRTYFYAHPAKPLSLVDDWRQAAFDYVPSDPRITVVRFYAEARGKGVLAQLDDAWFDLNPTPGYSMTIEHAHTMVRLGQPVTMGLALQGPDGPASGNVAVAWGEVGAPSTQDALALGKDGRAQLSLPTQEAGVFEVNLVHLESGVADRLYLDACEPEVYDAMAKAAQTALVPTPSHIIFVGDSLTALYRGYNYVDKVRGWLHQKYGPGVRVTNAGVGGDFTTRVLARLDRDVLAHKPTHVFVFLGHNDSKLKSTTNYEEPVVPVARFEAEYREIVKRIREHTGARVTIISATSSVYEITKPTADRSRAAGRAHNLFGKPAALEQFNAAAKRVARELGAGYLDVYEPTRAHPDKPSLFTRDGVHVSNRGNRLLALEILRHLGEPE